MNIPLNTGATERSSHSSVEDVLSYIDVTAPYFALRDLSFVHSDSTTEHEGISCTFNREQPTGAQMTSFCASEVGRHLAVLGSVAAAHANPVKQKHYYLALDANLRMNDLKSVEETLRGEAFISEASWQKHRVTCNMRAFTLCGQVYATLKVRYAIVPERRLLKMVSAPDTKMVRGNPWNPADPSPYCQPILLRLIRRSADSTATAIIPLHHIASMAGHFTTRPCAPIAILASNALALVAELVSEFFFCEEVIVKCSRLAVAGEILQVHASTVRSERPGGRMTHMVSLTDERHGLIGKIWFRLKEVNMPAARL